MRVNIFSGARRIAVVLAILAGLACGVLAAMENGESVDVTYSIIGTRPPEKITRCPSNNQERFSSIQTPSGNSLLVTLCFPRSTATDGRDYIAIETDASGQVTKWTEDFSPQFWSYTNAAVSNFKMPIDDAHAADRRLHDIWLRMGIYGICWFIGAGLVVWITAKIIGWIVRGFLGIPMGKDFRAESRDIGFTLGSISSASRLSQNSHLTDVGPDA